MAISLILVQIGGISAIPAQSSGENESLIQAYKEIKSEAGVALQSANEIDSFGWRGGR